MSAGALYAVVDKLVEEAAELVPVGVRALEGLLEGKAPEEVVTAAEREAIATYSRKLFRETLGKAQG